MQVSTVHRRHSVGVSTGTLVSIHACRPRRCRRQSLDEPFEGNNQRSDLENNSKANKKRYTSPSIQNYPIGLFDKSQVWASKVSKYVNHNPNYNRRSVNNTKSVTHPDKSVGNRNSRVSKCLERRLQTAPEFKQAVSERRIFKSCSIETFVEKVIDDEGLREESQALRRFRRAVRLMQLLSAFCLSIRRYAKREEFTIYDLYYYRDTLPAPIGRPVSVQDNAAFFDKSVFARQNTALNFPMWARWICSKRPEERTDVEISKLATLLRGLKCFGRFSRNAQCNLCRTISYACYEKHRIIVRQGHPGMCFYLIVSGSVSVIVTREDLKTKVSVTSTVDILSKNDAFGEIALISKGARRTASIMCRERVEVLLVDRENIFKYCPDVFHREHQDKIQALREHDLFRNWRSEDLNTIAHEAQIKEYSYGKLIDPDTTSSEVVYFVMKGKAEILRRLDLRKNRTLGVRAKSAGTRNKASRIVYVNIGAIADKQAWDLNCLQVRKSSGAKEEITSPVISLVSSGVRLLRMTKKGIINLCTRGNLERFSKTFTAAPFHRFTSDEQLCRDYRTKLHWLDYKEKVVQSVMDEKHHHPIAHTSRANKGFSRKAWTNHNGTTMI